MRDLAIRLLAEQKLPELLATRQRARAEVARLDEALRTATRNVSEWARVAFFYDSPEEKVVQALEAELATARAALEEANQRCEVASQHSWAACPPLEIAQRVEAVIARVLGQPGFGRLGQDAEVADELEAIAERVLGLWAPDVDTRAVAQALLGGQKAPPMGAPRRHPQLGWAPIGADELMARAGQALASHGALAITLERETAEYRAMTAQLEAARAAVTFGDVIVPGRGERERAVAWFEEAVSKEQREMIAAEESLLVAVERAIGAYPPMMVHVMAECAAGAFRAGAARYEDAIDPYTGALISRPAAYLRAFALAALHELRRATEGTFEGLPQLVSGRGGERDARDLERAARRGAVGPYRQEGSQDEAPAMPAPQTHDSEQAFFDDLERWQVRPLVWRALSHATMLTVLEAELDGERHHVGWLDRVVFWSDSDAQQARDRVEARLTWHRSCIEGIANEALGRVQQAASAQPLLGMHTLLVNAHRAIAAVHTSGGRSSTPRNCPAIGLEEAVGAIDALVAHLSRHYGAEGTRDQLVADVLSRLRFPDGAPPPTGRLLTHLQVVDGVAPRLRHTPFAALAQRIVQVRSEHAQAQSAAAQAAAQVSMWDRINIFSDSPAEQQRDEQTARAAAAWQMVSQDLAAANALLDEALRWYPPGAAYYALLEVRASVAHIHAVNRRHTTTRRVGNNTTTETYYTCQLVGRDPAVAALTHWAKQAACVWGPMPSASDLLERWIARDFTGRADAGG